MKGRSLVVVLGLILTMATVGTLSYHGIDYDMPVGRPMAALIVLKVDIPAGTDMDRLIWLDQFRLIEVPKEAVVDGAVTSLDQLRGESNRVAILAGEQIPIALFWSVGAMRRERLEFLGRTGLKAIAFKLPQLRDVTPMNVSSTTPTTIQMARLTAPPSLAFPLGLPEHPDQHRPERPILLAVDSRDVAPGGDQE